MKLDKNRIKKLLIDSLRENWGNTSSTIIRYHPKLGIFLLSLGQKQPNIRERFKLWEVLNKFKENLKKENKQ